MYNKTIKSFLLKRIEGPLLKNGKKLYEENFYINQQPLPRNDRNFLHCFAYAESIWSGKYQLKRSHNAFNRGNSENKYWSLECMVEGSAEFICNSIRYKVASGDIMILRPGNQITLRTDSNKYLKKKSVLLKSPLLEYICDSGGLAEINLIHSDKTPYLINIYNRIKQIILTQKEHWQQELSIEAYSLLCELNRLAKPNQYPLALNHVLEIIDNNPYKDYNLEGLSIQCGVSINTMSRLFKKYLHTSPINYIIDRRLEQAKLLLCINTMTLKEIAEKCGYKSESFLSRSFKNKFGMSPGQFRKQS